MLRISRRFERAGQSGYVLATGPAFFLMALIGDGIWFDGFACFRVADVGKVAPDPHIGFVEAALRQRREKLPDRPRVNRRKQGLDIVVCGLSDRSNRNKAADIERAAIGIGGYIRHGAHPSAGKNALPHYQPRTRPPDGHSFYETKGQKAL